VEDKYPCLSVIHGRQPIIILFPLHLTGEKIIMVDFIMNLATQGLKNAM